MSQYVDALAQARAEIKRLWISLLVVGGAAAAAVYGWKSATTSIEVHIPPDLSKGAVIKAGALTEVPDPNVYLFAYYIWQQLNAWNSDGQKDYPQQIFAMQYFVTPACREQLIADMNWKLKASELSGRTRALMEIPGLGYVEERVQRLDHARWQVLLDGKLTETMKGDSLKDVFIRYPLQVVRFDVDREKNPYRLAIDCFGSQRPERLDAKAVEMALKGHTIVATRRSVGRELPLDSPTLLEQPVGPSVPATGSAAPAILPSPQ